MFEIEIVKMGDQEGSQCFNFDIVAIARSKEVIQET